MFLSIDTSGVQTKLQLLSLDFSLISEKVVILENNLSEILTIEIEQLIENSGKKKSDLSAIFVCRGPGSYTGIRIGVTTANFIAFSLDIPIVSLKELEENKAIKDDRLIGEKFVKPVIPIYNRPPHITKNSIALTK